ncbi:MAG TPA: ribonuclease H-like domain-containing protein [Candidatus Limnocylindria bacterium]|nr:ribonuclease H-like domain-containing protein [Candidatus Limnocylindria bacterium]
MLQQRSLADRLAAIRAGHAPAVASRPALPDRAESLARWFSARLAVAEGGAAVVVERGVALSPPVAARLATLPPASYFDTETTGLSTGAGTVVFLSGTGWLDGSRLVVRQLLLPDYPHERALLRLLGAHLAERPRLVTYNGRGFDMPLLIARLTVNGLFREQAALPERHDDLLPVARRLFRRPLGGARLADVETGVLGVHRASDCPGSEVPMRYFGYLRGGSPDLLAEVLDHNLQDIVSLALLESEVLRLRAGGWRDATVLDRRGMAVELMRDGAVDDALALLEEASFSVSDPGEVTSLRRLATRLMLAAGELDRAEALWTAGTRRASLDAAAAWIEVARIRERHRGDLQGALEAAAAASRVLDLAFALGRGGSLAEVGRIRLRVESRLRRLRTWTQAAERRRARATRRAEPQLKVAAGSR